LLPLITAIAELLRLSALRLHALVFRVDGPSYQF